MRYKKTTLFITAVLLFFAGYSLSFSWMAYQIGKKTNITPHNMKAWWGRTYSQQQVFYNACHLDATLTPGQSLELRMDVADYVRRLANNPYDSILEDILKKANTMQEKAPRHPFVSHFTKVIKEQDAAKHVRYLMADVATAKGEKLGQQANLDAIAAALTTKVNQLLQNTVKQLAERLHRHGFPQARWDTYAGSAYCYITCPAHYDMQSISHLLTASNGVQFYKTHIDKDKAQQTHNLIKRIKEQQGSNFNPESLLAPDIQRQLPKDVRFFKLAIPLQDKVLPWQLQTDSAHTLIVERPSSADIIGMRYGDKIEKTGVSITLNPQDAKRLEDFRKNAQSSPAPVVVVIGNEIYNVLHGALEDNKIPLLSAGNDFTSAAAKRLQGLLQEKALPISLVALHHPKKDPLLTVAKRRQLVVYVLMCATLLLCLAVCCGIVGSIAFVSWLLSMLFILGLVSQSSIAIGIPGFIALGIITAMTLIAYGVLFSYMKAAHKKGGTLTQLITQAYDKAFWKLVYGHAIMCSIGLLGLLAYRFGFTAPYEFSMVLAIGSGVAGFCTLFMNKLYWLWGDDIQWSTGYCLGLLSI